MTEYRMLEEGEVIQEGDEYFSLVSEEWRKSESVGNPLQQYLTNLYRRPIKEKKGTGMFVEKTVVKKIVGTVDGNGPGNFLMSVKEEDCGRIQLVVGAWWEYRCANLLTKQTLGQLIEELKDIHSAMKDSK